MQTYLGLDIGTYSIKAVILKINFENYYIEDLVEQEIPHSQDPEDKSGRISTLRTILSMLKTKEFDSIYASLGAQYTIMKRFDLNNVQRSDRQKIIESEFEILGLFNLDDYAIEYHTIKFDKNFAKLLAIMIHKPSAKILIDTLEAANLSVRVIDIDNIVYLNLMNFLPKMDYSPSRGVELFLDIGHSKTTFTVIENNRIINTRVLNFGGTHLTELIQNKLHINYQDAQNLKHNIQSLDGHESYRDVTGVMDQFFEEVSLEIRRTIQSMNATEQLKIGRIFITGGSSKYEKVFDIFEKSLETKPFNLEFASRNLKFSAINGVDFKTFSQVISISFRANLAPSNSKINIRHGSLALISNYEKIISEVAKYSKLAALFIFLLVGTFFVRYFLYNARITDMKTQFKQEIVKMMTTEPKELKVMTMKKDWDLNEYSVKALKILKESKQDRKDLIDNLSLNKGSTPLKILNDVSLAIPKSIPFEVVNFKYQDGIVSFEADTNNSASVGQIVEKLNEVKILTQVVKKSEASKAGTDGQVVHFTIAANVSAKGD